MNIWVIDTSAIIGIRRSLPDDGTRRAVTSELDEWVFRGALTFPLQVLDELQRFTETISRKQRSDPPYRWAKKNEQTATRHGSVYTEAREVLERVPNLIDPEKVAIEGVDDADPYVIGLALALDREGHKVTIITEDFNTFPYKTALADAAGLFRIPTVRFLTFLRDEEIWPSLGGVEESE